MTNKIILDVENVSHWFDRSGKNRILHEINLQVVQGQFVAMVGASGCGKSTLLRAILGTHPPKQGSIEVSGVRMDNPNRNVGIVYQRYGLYRFLTAESNVAFGLKLDQTSLWRRAFLPWKWWPLRKKHLEEARELLKKLKLEKALGNWSSELSGGMRQRVAIAQALIMKPKILLLDEPFGALDASTREDLQEMLLVLYQENLEAKRNGMEPPWTIIFVTHELDEAFYVSDRIVGLSRSWCEEGENGKRIFGEECGSTKVWDKCTPVYHPDAPRDFSIFAAQKKLLRQVVLDGNSNIPRSSHVSFWSDLENGVGTGVAITRIENNETIT